MKTSTPLPAGQRRELALRLGNIAGVEVKLDWSLILIFCLITLNLGAGVFRQWHPDWGALPIWGTALAAAVLFLGSVLLHELSHALTARLFGLEVEGITLFLFGGVSRLAGEPRSSGSELVIAIAGPVTSFAIGAGASAAAFAMLAAGFSGTPGPDDLERVMQTASPLVTLLAWLGPVNLALALFNLVPAFPLDGGRVLRSVLWAASGDFSKATRWAARGGQLFAGLLAALGFVQLLSGRVGPGLWWVLLAWFLASAARASLFQLSLKEAFAEVPVLRLVQRRFDGVPPELSVGELVARHLLHSQRQSWLVERDGRLLGSVAREDVRRVPETLWDQTPISELMTPVERLVTVGSGDSAHHAFEVMAKHGIDELPVVHLGEVLGVIRQDDLLRWLSARPSGPGRLTPLHH